jgi:hypothetical protein
MQPNLTAHPEQTGGQDQGAQGAEVTKPKGQMQECYGKRLHQPTTLSTSARLVWPATANRLPFPIERIELSIRHEVRIVTVVRAGVAGTEIGNTIDRHGRAELPRTAEIDHCQFIRSPVRSRVNGVAVNGKQLDRHRTVADQDTLDLSRTEVERSGYSETR